MNFSNNYFFTDIEQYMRLLLQTGIGDLFSK